MFYALPTKNDYYDYDCGCGCNGLGDCEGDEMGGFWSAIGNGFKIAGKVALKAGTASGIPGLSQGAAIADSVISGMGSGGGGGNNEEKLRKNCAKKPNGKGCAELFARDKQIADAQAAAKQKEDMQMALMQKLVEKQDKPAGIGGIDPMYLLIGGGALVVVMLMTRN